MSHSGVENALVWALSLPWFILGILQPHRNCGRDCALFLCRNSDRGKGGDALATRLDNAMKIELTNSISFRYNFLHRKSAAGLAPTSHSADMNNSREASNGIL